MDVSDVILDSLGGTPKAGYHEEASAIMRGVSMLGYQVYRPTSTGWIQTLRKCYKRLRHVKIQEHVILVHLMPYSMRMHSRKHAIVRAHAWVKMIRCCKSLNPSISGCKAQYYFYGLR